MYETSRVVVVVVAGALAFKNYSETECRRLVRGGAAAVAS